MNISNFRVYHATTLGTPIAERVALGSAKLTDDHARFNPAFEAQDFFNKQRAEWIIPFQRNVRRMVKAIGHNGKFSASWDENTGIGVERI